MNEELVKKLMKDAVAQSFSEFATDHAQITIMTDKRGGKIIGDIPIEFIKKYTDLVVRECARIADETQFKTRNYPVSIALEIHFEIGQKIDSDIRQVIYDKEFK